MDLLRFRFGADDLRNIVAGLTKNSELAIKLQGALFVLEQLKAKKVEISIRVVGDDE